MLHYRIRPDAFKALRKQTIFKSLPISILAFIGGIVISMFNSADWDVLRIVLPLGLISITLGILRGIKRQNTLWKSYLLTVSGNLITREQLNTPTVSIYFNEIQTIGINKKGYYTIKGKNPTDVIYVSPYIESYNTLSAQLAAISPINVEEKKNFFQKNATIILVILSIGLLFCVYARINRILTEVSGIISLVFYSWSIYKIRISKNIDASTKRLVWFMLLPLLSILGIVVLTFLGIKGV